MNISLFICVVILLFVFGAVYTECPPGWLHHGSSCYFFSDDTFPWDIAHDLCKEYHGYLAEVDTKAESDYLEAFTRPRQKEYWLGGTDSLSGGHWYWANSKKPFSFTDWVSGEPNDSGNNEDCLHLYAEHDQHWNDWACTNMANYICETSFDAPSP